jgi:metal-responsive CopG/Arc/MetJ family transcriptional regulator
MADKVRKGGRLRPPINITIAASILRRIDAAAKEAGQSRSIWIQIACAERLEREKASAPQSQPMQGYT